MRDHNVFMQNEQTLSLIILKYSLLPRALLFAVWSLTFQLDIARTNIILIQPLHKIFIPIYDKFLPSS